MAGGPPPQPRLEVVVDIADHDTGHAASPPGMISLISLISNKLISDRSGPPAYVCDRRGPFPTTEDPPCIVGDGPRPLRPASTHCLPGASQRTPGSVSTTPIFSQQDTH